MFVTTALAGLLGRGQLVGGLDGLIWCVCGYGEMGWKVARQPSSFT